MSDSLKMGPNFPRAPQACKGVTEPFFACLLKHSEKEGE
jgi:hypothetical protein